MTKRVGIIGSGISGLAAAAFLSKNNFDVDIYEKNPNIGGRLGKLESNGFRFDLGPSFYWMPDVFERFFEQFGKKVADFYHLKRLDPGYRIFFGKNELIDVPASTADLFELFEKYEPGSSVYLQKFLADAKVKYKLGMGKVVYRPGLSLGEYMDRDLIKGLPNLNVFRSISSEIKKNFTHPWLIRLLQFPVIFLGATPDNTPSLYSLMNYADLELGTWYPMGGMYKLSQALESLAKSQGVTIHPNTPVEKIYTEKNQVNGIAVNGSQIPYDYVLSSADYHHTEQQLLPQQKRQFSKTYWEKKTFAPSAVMIYLGINKKLENLQHHNLFFDENFEQHAEEIYNKPQWPEKPALYVSCSSVTDPSVAPEGHENLVILIPVAPGLKDTEEIREKYFELAIQRIEKITGQSFKDNIVFQKIIAHHDFTEYFNAYKGNAYGLANTLRQTAILRPPVQSRKLKNMYFSGQLTVPGPGLPPCLISGEIVAREIIKSK